ncbi:hypothetical protein EKO27_g4148 [Xylaria grammica]|uniref:HNH nuclease domain-containing protein n=1 Tax=Xylaria grammica TaxID=363999 RepID=A0A439D9A5_9PEZI|nr:hypothetical protein EKO27_g4148 [Xylaria grammica]
MVVIRPKLTDISQQEARPPRVVDFLHPAYPDGANVLLTLYAVDDDGIDYDFAHTACGIICNNAFAEGWLARRLQVDGHDTYQPVPRELLKDESYYFCVGQNTSPFDLASPYPIVTRFDDWEFPHQIWAPNSEYGERPISTWTRCQISPRGTEYPGALSDPKMVIRTRDRTCRVTTCSEATEVAHLVPSANASWFDRNRMTRYCSSPIPSGGRSGIDDDKNGVLLRRDLHWLLDAARFVFVPKRQDDEGNPVLLVHVLQPGATTELLHLYHNRALQSALSVAMPLLFARFALSILKSAAPFLSAGEQQQCKVRVFDSAASKYRVRTMTRGEMTAHRTKSRSMSPRKRSKAMDGEDLAALDSDWGSSSSGDRNEDSWCATEISEAESDSANQPERGRPRKRKRGWNNSPVLDYKSWSALL